MTPDQILPAVSALLQRRYVESIDAYLAGTPYARPKRKTRKKPFPGVHDALEPEG